MSVTRNVDGGVRGSITSLPSVPGSDNAAMVHHVVVRYQRQIAARALHANDDVPRPPSGLTGPIIARRRPRETARSGVFDLWQPERAVSPPSAERVRGRRRRAA